jgi:hypothetical protein
MHVSTINLITKKMSPTSALKMQTIIKGLLKKPSQFKVAKSMILKKNLTKGVNVRTSRITRSRAPSVLPNSKYAGGSKTVQNLLLQYTQAPLRNRKLKTIQNNMKRNQNALPKKLKNMLNRKFRI